MIPSKKFKLAAVTAVGLLVVWYIRQSPEVLLEEVLTVDFPEKIIKIDIDAQVQPSRTEYLVVRQGGSLDDIKFNIGDRIETGQIIAAIDSGRHEARLRRALSQYSLAAADFSRSSQLYRSRTETKQDLDRAQNAVTVARADVEEAKKNLEDSIVRAPFPGILTHLAFKKGDYVPNGSRIAAIEDYSEVVVRGRMPKHTRAFFPYLGNLSVKTPDAVVHSFINAKVDITTAEEFFEDDFDIELKLDSTAKLSQVRAKVVMTFELKKLEKVTQLPASSVDLTNGEYKVLVLSSQSELKWQQISVVLSFGSDIYIPQNSIDGKIVQMIRAKELKKYIGQKIRPKLAPVAAASKKDESSL